MNKVTLWVTFWSLVVVAFGYLFLSWASSYEKNIEEIKAEECKRRVEKQLLLDNMLYTETVSYVAWKYNPANISEIDQLLIDAISDASECDGVYYHHVNIEELFWFLVPKASASKLKEYNPETIIVYNSIVHLWLDVWLALHIATSCEWSWDRQHCYKFTVWVMKAESTLCKNAWDRKNCFGMMHRPKRNNYQRTIKSYDSYYASIDDFTTRYKKFWQWRITTAHWVAPIWNYCTDHCQHREWNVQYAINQMNKQLD